MNKDFGLRIKKQGLPVVSIHDKIDLHPTVYLNTDEFIIGHLDISWKWCYISHTTSGGRPHELGFAICASERTPETVGLSEEELDNWTEVEFIGLDEKWSVFEVDCNRYTVSFVLWNMDRVIKRMKQENCELRMLWIK